MLSPTKTPVLPGTGPQLPNAADRHRVLYIWDVYHPDWVKPEDAYKYLVPRENEVILDPENNRVYRCTHVNMESDLKPTLAPIFGTGEDKGGLESIFGLPGGFQGEAVLGIDYSVRPNRAVIDGQVMCPGAAYALLYRGNVVGAEGEVISVLYGSNRQMISNRIPVKLAALHELTNSEIMVTEPFSVNKNESELPDGSRVTLVWFDHAGNPIPKARTLSVMHTAIMRDHHVGKKYITKVSLIAPWFTNSNDADTLYVPMNTELQSLAFRAQVHYSDGSRSEELPIDGSKIKLFGVNEHKPSTSGQRGTLTLVYDLDKDESMYEAQPGSPNQYRKSFWVLATDFDGAYSPRIYSYPDWQGNQYRLRHFLTDLNRGFSVEVTEHVRLNELSPAFRPTTYGVEQTLELNLRLSDTVPSFKPLIMRQSITYVLKGPGGDTGSKFSVRYSYDRPSYNDVTLRAVNMADGKQEITFGVAFGNQKEWLDTLYSGLEPGYSVTMENGPLTPTHFQIIASSTKVYEFSLSDWNKKLYLDQQEPQGRMVAIRWIHQTTQGEKLILAISGLTIDVKQGGGVLPPKATAIQADSTLPTSVMEGSVITVSGMVYDQYGNPYRVGDQKVWVDGGIHGKQEVNVNGLGEFSLLTIPKGVAGTKETFNFSFTETGEVLSKYEPDVVVNNQNVIAKVYPYSPKDVHLGKPGRVYGYLTRDGQPLANYTFYRSIDNDPTSFKKETTDKNGEFVIQVVKPNSTLTANVWIHVKDKISHQLTWKDQVAFGEVVTSDKEFWMFEETEGIELKGKVYDQFGNLASGISAMITKGPEWEIITDDQTTPLGGFTLRPSSSHFELEEETEVVMFTSGGFVKTKLVVMPGKSPEPEEVPQVQWEKMGTYYVSSEGQTVKAVVYDHKGLPMFNKEVTFNGKPYTLSNAGEFEFPVESNQTGNVTFTLQVDGISFTTTIDFKPHNVILQEINIDPLVVTKGEWVTVSGRLNTTTNADLERVRIQVTGIWQLGTIELGADKQGVIHHEIPMNDVGTYNVRVRLTDYPEEQADFTIEVLEPRKILLVDGAISSNSVAPMETWVITARLDAPPGTDFSDEWLELTGNWESGEVSIRGDSEGRIYFDDAIGTPGLYNLKLTLLSDTSQYVEFTLIVREEMPAPRYRIVELSGGPNFETLEPR